MVALLLAASLELGSQFDLNDTGPLAWLPPGLGVAVRHMVDVGGIWYRVVWDCQAPVYAWNRDTIQVCMRDSSKVQVLEQFATTPPPTMDRRLLVGLVRTSDLNKKPWKHGPAILVWIRLPDPIDPKQVVGLRVRSP